MQNTYGEAFFTHIKNVCSTGTDCQSTSKHIKKKYNYCVRMSGYREFKQF